MIDHLQPDFDLMLSFGADIITLENSELSYDFKGNILHLESISTSTSAASFNFINVEDDSGQSVFKVKGSGTE